MRQNILLFDSLRCEYPIGTFLTSTKGSIESIRPLTYASENISPDDVDYLLLDGQQRITAGLQLFYADKKENKKIQKTFYFIDLSRLRAIVKEFEESKNIKISPESKNDIEALSEEIDGESGYLVARSNIKEPELQFIRKRLVFSSLLRKENFQKLHFKIEEYREKYPEDERLIEIFLKLFVSSNDYDQSIPVISIESKDPRIMTRIFSTLNNTGTSLTPFEITVSEMFGQDVNLREDIQKLSNGNIFYPRIDKDNNLVLQTCILLSEAKISHKKTDLPKSLSREIWNTYKEDAFSCIEILGKFLTEELGAGVDTSSDYIPYDTAILPLICLINKYNPYDLDNKTKKILTDVIRYYFVGSALKLRFTEGATSKQIIDKLNLLKSVEEKTPEAILKELGDKIFTGLGDVTKSGAKGRITLCVQSANELKDPLSGSSISLSKKHELHHIFPKSYVEDTLGVTVKDLDISIDNICNLMIVEPDTNLKFSKLDPASQLEMAGKSNGDYEESYRRHFIDEACIKILRKSKKSVQDYYDFIKARSKVIESHIAKRYKVQSMAIKGDDIDSDEDAD